MLKLSIFFQIKNFSEKHNTYTDRYADATTSIMILVAYGSKLIKYNQSYYLKEWYA